MGLAILPCGSASPLLLLGHLPSRSTAISSSVASLSPKSCPGLNHRGVKPLRAKASGEETSTVVVEDDSARKQVEEPSFVMQSSSEEENAPLNDVFSKLNMKVDYEKAYTILFYGSGALIALWVSAAIVSSVDSLPVFPKVMEIVGLGFTVWFTSRYLIFKENRDEFLRKLDDLKEKILGSND